MLALATLQVQQLQVKASELPRTLQELQDVQAQVQQLQDAAQRRAALQVRVAELQAEVRPLRWKGRGLESSLLLQPQARCLLLSLGCQSL